MEYVKIDTRSFDLEAAHTFFWGLAFGALLPAQTIAQRDPIRRSRFGNAARILLTLCTMVAFVLLILSAIVADPA